MTSSLLSSHKLTLVAALSFVLATASPQALVAQEQPLLPDTPAAPSLTYSTYLGGSSSDSAQDVAIGANGDIYVLGATFSEDFLGMEATPNGGSDLFVAHLSAAGDEVLWVTLIGGGGTDNPANIGVDAQGNVYATARSYVDDDFPLKNALYPERPDNSNTILFKLNAQGDLVYSTWLPFDTFDAANNLTVDGAGNAYVTGTVEGVMEGDTPLGNQIGLLKISPIGDSALLDVMIGRTNHDDARAIAIDAAGAIYLAGVTQAHWGSPSGSDFPVTPNAQQPECGDTWLGDGEYCIEDAVVIVLDKQGAITYASYLGGSSAVDEPVAIATDGHGLVTVVGSTVSKDFPVLNALQATCPIDTDLDICYMGRGFISATRIQAPKASLVYSTYFGSKERESWTQPEDATMDALGNLYFTGMTDGEQIPVKQATQPIIATGICPGMAALTPDATDVRFCYDGFVTKLDAGGALAFGTYLGGTADEYLHGIALGGASTPAGALFAAGISDSLDLPTTANALQSVPPLPRNGVLARIDMGGSGAAVSVTLSAQGSGGRISVRVISRPSEVEVAATYPVGTVLELTAIAGAGNHFTGWGGDLSGSANPVRVTVNGPLAITANFAEYAHHAWLPGVER